VIFTPLNLTAFHSPTPCIIMELKCCGLYRPLNCCYRTSPFARYVVRGEIYS